VFVVTEPIAMNAKLAKITKSPTMWCFAIIVVFETLVTSR
jgi:hypothetical protein